MSAAAAPVGPQNLEAEAALLGAMMIDNRIIDRVLDRCEPADMSDALHQRIFAAIVQQQALGKKATPVTLRTVFETDPAMIEIGGPGYLAQLTANGAALLAANDFADQIKELAKLRKLRARMAEALARIDAGGADPTKVAADLEAAAWLTQDAHNNAVTEMTWADAMRLVVERQKRVDAGVEKSGWQCDTICDLNEITGGLQPGWLTILAGRPAMGKTATATSAGLGYARQGVGVGFISLEMDSLALGQRLAADYTHLMGKPVAYQAIRDARMVKEDMERVKLATDFVDRLPLEMVDVSRMTLSRVAAAIRRLKRKMAGKGRALQVVFIDYLTLIDPDTPSKNRSVDVGTISRGLKAIAKQESICIVALAQLSRGVEAREDKRPMLQDLRDSGEIEQDADAVIFVYRDEYYLKQAMPDPDQPEKFLKWQTQMENVANRIEFIAAKVRAGEVKTCRGFFFGQNQAVRGSDFYARARV